MTPAAPFIAYPTTPHLQHEVRHLLEQLQARARESQADTATRLIQGAAHELIETFFTALLLQLKAAGQVAAYRDAEAMVREIDDKLTYYLGWASGFFSNDRIRPAVEHYQSMMVQLPSGGDMSPHIAFAISRELSLRAEHALPALQRGDATSASEGIEVLISVIDEALTALLITPKKLMKFNFVVDKTLNGVISLTQTLAYRSLRKLAEQMPAAHQPVLAAHMQRFLYSNVSAQVA